MKRAGRTAAPSRGPTLVYAIAACLAVAGLADAVYLLVMHLTGQYAMCGESGGCAQVLGSRFAQIGPIPVAALGVLAYFTVFSFATLAAFGWAQARLFLAAAVGGMFAGTLWLLFVQAVLLHHFCRYCLLSAAITFLLTGLIVAIWPSTATRPA